MIELSSTFTYTTKSPPQVSPDGEFVAYVVGDKLVIRRTSTLATKKIVSLPRQFGRQIAEVAWDRSLDASPEQRLLARAADEIRTYAIDASGLAEASIAPGKFEVAAAEWRSCQPQKGQPDQIVRVVGFSRYGLRASVWSSDGLELDIPFVKFPRTIDINGENFGVLVRRKTQDELVIFSLKKMAETGQAVRRLPLKGMLDTKEIKWSPDGLYFSARDNTSIGFKVNIFGADGTLIHVCEGPSAVRDEFEQGALATEWTTLNGRSTLIIGDRSERIVVVDGTTYRHLAVLHHNERIDDDVPVWVEGISTPVMYSLAQLPFIVPSYKPDLPGVSLLKISPDGKYLATRVDSMPSTVWIWSLRDTVQLHSVLCHSSYVHTVQWSRDSTRLLVIPTKGGLVGVPEFNSQDQQVPYLASFSSCMESISGGQWADCDRFVVWDAQNFAVALIPASAERANSSSEDAFQNVLKRDTTAVQDTDDAQDEGNDSGMSLEEELNAVNDQHNAQLEKPEGVAIDNDEELGLVASDTDLSMREGSPAQLQDDDTRVRDIVNGVQQNEWIEDPEDIKPEDTFHGRRASHGRQP
ncbi:hypothetical protein TRVA0_034S00342 [Trichomonascus vanleenenianus]|uniref:uncharacterized protein n=1 Tax=Trichomonascus vanleenenianus TaxID=2268995 RepID=UPI003ECB7F80